MKEATNFARRWDEEGKRFERNTYCQLPGKVVLIGMGWQNRMRCFKKQGDVSKLNKLMLNNTPWCPISILNL